MARAVSDYPKAIAPLALIAMLPDGESVEVAAKRGGMGHYLTDLESQLCGSKVADCALADQYPPTLDRQYWKHLHSFWCIQHENDRIASVRKRCARRLGVLSEAGLVDLDEVCSVVGITRSEADLLLSDPEASQLDERVIRELAKVSSALAEKGRGARL